MDSITGRTFIAKTLFLSGGTGISVLIRGLESPKIQQKADEFGL
jgi:2-phospho-L-lactate transferase/gluconeogenesis factor (CofD/UPF0052 family)